MCTAYQIGKKANQLPARVAPQAAALLRSLSEFRIIRPTLSAPVILPDGSLREMAWGFRRTFRGAKGQPIHRTVVNSREDKLDSTMWSDAFRNRRCLIPAMSFYEWVEGPGGKTVPLRFTREDDEWLLLGGIWEEGSNGPCFSMLTTEPSTFVSQVHDRMPLVLADDQIDPYLDRQLQSFGSSSVPLQHSPAANFLRRDSQEPELF